MPQKIKQMGEFKLGDWVTFYSPQVALEIIAFSTDRKSAHLRNIHGVLMWQPLENVSRYSPPTDEDQH